MSCWAYCKPESEFYSIFGSEPVPIQSLVPIIPRERGCPPCYVVLVHLLNAEQVRVLAHKLFEQWQPECTSINQAYDYLMDGLPLKTTHFNGWETDEFKYIAASNEATIESDFDEVSR